MKSVAPISRIQELDSLRGIAALGVMLYHYTVRYPQIFNVSPGFIFNFPAGVYGVPLFFIISGYVILMTVEKTQSAQKFLISRFARLYPAYWVAVMFTFLLVKTFSLPGLEVGRLSALINLTMFQAFLTVPNVDGSYWTLAVELIFYLLMAGLLFWKKDFCVEKISLVALLAIVIFKLPLNVANPYLLFAHYANLFIAGMIFYRLKTRGKNWERNLILLFCLLVQLLVFPWPDFLAVAGFFLIFYLLLGNRLGFLKHRALLFLGAISYPLYLIHEYFGYLLIRQLSFWRINPSLILIFTVTAAIFIATLIHFFVELPGQKIIKKRFLPN